MAPDRPTPAAPPYSTAWNVAIAADGPLTLTLAGSIFVLAGPETATEARAPDDGRVLWTSSERLVRAPVFVDGKLIGPSERQLVALDAESGTVRWAVDLAGATEGAASAEDRIFVAEGSVLKSYRAADGGLLWQRSIDAAATLRPAFDASMVYLALADRSLAAFARESGEPVWRAPLDVTPRSLAVAGERLYLGAAEGFACAYRVEHGRKDWCFHVRVRPIGTPVTDDRHVYFAFLDNMVHVFDRRSGRRYFTPSLDALPSDGPVLTPEALIVPVVTGEFVLLNPQQTFAPTRVSSPRSVQLPYTRAAAISPDGQRLGMVIASPGGRTLFCFTRTPPAPPEPAKTDDTASDTPPARPKP